MIAVQFVCKGKDSHKSRELRRLELADRGFGTTANEIAMNRIIVVNLRGSKRGDMVQSLSDPVPVSDGGTATVLPFICPSCKLNRQIKYVDLVYVMEKLHAAGLSSVDVSALPEPLR